MSFVARRTTAAALRRRTRPLASSAAAAAGAQQQQQQRRRRAPGELRADPALADFVRAAEVDAANSRGTQRGIRKPQPRDTVPLYGNGPAIRGREFKVLGKRTIKSTFERFLPDAPADMWMDYYAAASVLPMRTNPYVLEELVDWSNIPNDPIFQLVFPQPGMVEAEGFKRVRELVGRGASATELREAVRPLREAMNPHPAGQKTMNVPHVNGVPVPGLQHKYRETVLFFPSAGQYCQSFCTYCFRWAQFVGDDDLQFASKESAVLHAYLKQNKQVSDLLFTGGDPMVMRTHEFRRFIEPMLNNPDFDHITTIRVGTKAVSYWPYRFVTDEDADDLMRLIEEVNAAGKQFAIMAHYTHPREISTPVAEEAVRRLRNAGAVIRCQAPLIRNINDDPDTWAEMWRRQVRLGANPYYFFVERDTGASHYFSVPLLEAHDIYAKAIRQVSGVARTVRGPSMSASPGKCQVLGEAEVNGEKVMALQFLQSRNPDWSHRVFFAKHDTKATWLNELRPAFGDKFFFEDELKTMELADASSGQGPIVAPQGGLSFEATA